jgi:hypothetical protein
MKEVIGVKSKGNSFVYRSFFVVSLVVFTFSLLMKLQGQDTRDEVQVLLIGSLIMMIIMGIILISIKNKPTNAIECDGEYLYINEPDTVIKIQLTSIVHVAPRRIRSRYMTYTFGRLTVHTADKRYETTVVISECEEVAHEIMKLAAKNNKHIVDYDI